MSVFRFKKFEVTNERSAMKVGTDGVLLGAAATLKPSDKAVLDVGTGTGVIALMAAQRLAAMADNGESLDFQILGIDIDGPSASEAGSNFGRSPWSGNLSSMRISLAEFSRSYPESKFDLILSNPPYYDDSLQNPDPRKNTARHTSDPDSESLPDGRLSYRGLIEFASAALVPDGRLSLILPADMEATLFRFGRSYGLSPFRLLRISTTSEKRPSRTVAEFAKSQTAALKEETIVIQYHGAYTPAYRSLVHDFYLWA
jgi:tRNA1Val (adenine37-N6)-methyltransferase